ncbi:hypothetical protein [Nocardiopsis sp. CC223A]|uniref:hypothetical protein n=1 Tax=Nocardiopsis sp. CC223A TaxID=3044051 RepID=UPI00278BDDBA|nr:hypothetical protein [Nocardiopsis sp. CC223A]
MAQGRWDEAVAIIVFERENPGAFRIRGLLSPSLEVPGVASGVLPKEVAALSDEEIPLVARLTEMVWEGGVLRVRGYAHVRNVPVPERPRIPTLAWLTRKGSRKRIPLRVTPRVEPLATLHSKQALHCYDGSGFEISVDPGRLRSGGKWAKGTWSLTLAVWAFGKARKDGIAPGDIGTSGHAHSHRLDEGTRWVSDFVKKRLEFRVEPVRTELRGHSVNGDHLALDLSGAVEGLVVSFKGEDGEQVERVHPVSTEAGTARALLPPRRPVDARCRHPGTARPGGGRRPATPRGGPRRRSGVGPPGG